MPPYKQVPSLQSSTLKVVAYFLRRLCCDCTLTTSDLQPVVEHIQVHIPPQIQAYICRTLLQYTNKIVFPELLNQKYLMVCTQLHAEYLWINDDRTVLRLVEELDGHSVQTLKMIGSHSKLDYDFDTNMLAMRRLPPLKVPLSCYTPDQVAVEPGNFIMPLFFEDWYPSYASLSIKPDDVWVVTYPKTGTTWTQELVWCLLHDRNSPEAKQELMRRFPFLEFDSLLSPSWDPEISEDDPVRLGNSWKRVQQMPSRRTIKSHLPKDLLPPQLWHIRPKIVYVCRDPRDACVSYYFHHRKLEGYAGSFEDFVETFLGDRVTYSPFWLHILGFWEMRNEDHILFLRYEDMKEDLAGVVRQVAAFLEVEVDDAQVLALVHHCSFDQMKANPATNNETLIDAANTENEGIKFMRKGQVGDWKNHLTEKQQMAFKEWTDRYLDGSDFPYYRD